MRRSGTRDTAWVLFVLFVATIVSIAALDRSIATWSHGLHKPAWCVWLSRLAEVPAPASVLTLAAAGLAALGGRRPSASVHPLLIACVSTLVAVAAVFVLKNAFGRTWPETWVANNPSWIGTHTYGFFPFHGGIGWSSFPSGHLATVSAPVASVLARSSRWRLVLAALPTLVAIGLLGANFHFLGDCLAGAFLGVASAGCVSLVDERTWP